MYFIWHSFHSVDVVEELQAIGNGTISSNTNLGELLAKAQMILEELKDRDLNPGKEAAEEEKRLAQEREFGIQKYLKRRLSSGER